MAPTCNCISSSHTPYTEDIFSPRTPKQSNLDMEFMRPCVHHLGRLLEQFSLFRKEKSLDTMDVFLFCTLRLHFAANSWGTSESQAPIYSKTSSSMPYKLSLLEWNSRHESTISFCVCMLTYLQMSASMDHLLVEHMGNLFITSYLLFCSCNCKDSTVPQQTLTSPRAGTRVELKGAVKSSSRSHLGGQSHINHPQRPQIQHQYF
jgi:hypothetical protein